MSYLIKPYLFKQFGKIQESNGFFLIADYQYKNKFIIDKNNNNYLINEVIYADYLDFENVIHDIPSFSHIFIVSPRFVSPLVFEEHKILYLGTASTDMSFDDVVDAINIMTNTNVSAQEAWISNFLSLLVADQKVDIVDPSTHTKASFVLSEGNDIGIMGGLMDWGDSWASISGECGFFP
ncbi:MAG: hypothetical protein F6K32_15870, partial [Desertifilum sp. SIO1I2]|nr:hypothetical protein [Desertifilum sp. SIO1I2]